MTDRDSDWGDGYREVASDLWTIAIHLDRSLEFGKDISCLKTGVCVGLHRSTKRSAQVCMGLQRGLHRSARGLRRSAKRSVQVCKGVDPGLHKSA